MEVIIDLAKDGANAEIHLWGDKDFEHRFTLSINDLEVTMHKRDAKKLLEKLRRYFDD